MLNNLNLPNFVTRVVATGAFIGLMGGAHADVKFLATVTDSGGGSGLPLAGIYEVDFKPDSARIVEPDGRVRLINFVSRQVYTLDPAHRTYTTEFLNRFLEPESGAGKTVSYAKDEATAPEEMFGASASKVFIRTLGTQTGRAARQFATRPGVVAPASGVSGVTWIVDASNVRGDVSSVAPLVWIGVPRLYAAAITRDMDQNGSVPISFFFFEGNNASAFLTMKVTSVNSLVLDPSIYSVPNGYRQVVPRR